MTPVGCLGLIWIGTYTENFELIGLLGLHIKSFRKKSVLIIHGGEARRPK